MCPQDTPLFFMCQPLDFIARLWECSYSASKDTDMQEINLDNDDYHDVEQRERTAAMCVGIKGYTLGKAITRYTDGRFHKVYITKVIHTQVQHLTNEDAKAQGYDRIAWLVDDLRQAYEGYRSIVNTTRLTVVHFELRKCWTRSRSRTR